MSRVFFKKAFKQITINLACQSLHNGSYSLKKKSPQSKSTNACIVGNDSCELDKYYFKCVLDSMLVKTKM